MSEELQEVIEQHWTEPYKVNGVLELYLEGPAEILNQLVPPGVKWGIKKDGSQKTIKELSPHWWESTEDGNVILLCCAMEMPIIRQHPFSEEDAEIWKYFKEVMWSSIGPFMTREEAVTKVKRTEGV